MRGSSNCYKDMNCDMTRGKILEINPFRPDKHMDIRVMILKHRTNKHAIGKWYWVDSDKFELVELDERGEK